MREEFHNTMDWIKPSIDAMRHSAKDLKDSKEIHEIFYLVLIAGNFLNAVSIFIETLFFIPEFADWAKIQQKYTP